MANGHGGYRAPANPAPVSGPGRYSRRTDGQIISTAPGQDYGAAKQQAMQQQTAPMGAAQPLPTPPQMPTAPQSGQPPQAPAFAGTPLGAPTQNPGQPITHGVDIGAGAGTNALQLGPFGQSDGRFAPADGSMTKMLSQLSATDTTGVLADLLQHAAAQGA